MFDAVLRPEQAIMLNPLVLAYVGDSVCDLYIRTHLTVLSDSKAGALHDKSKKYVSAYGQAAGYDKISETLTEKEQDICRRARNHHNKTLPKNTDLETYKKATSFEALIGYIYLIDDKQRLHKILKGAYSL